MTTNTAIQPATDGRRDATEHQPAWTYRPDTDVIETPGAYLVVTDLPGATPEGVSVTFEDAVLTIEAQAQRSFPDRAEFRRQEFGVGAYHRRFGINDRIDAEHIDADYANGVLTVRLPKTGAAQRRQIQVRSA